MEWNVWMSGTKWRKAKVNDDKMRKWDCGETSNIEMSENRRPSIIYMCVVALVSKQIPIHTQW